MGRISPADCGATEPMEKLPVVKLALFSYSNIFRDFRVFWRIAWFPAVVFFVFEFVFDSTSFFGDPGLKDIVLFPVLALTTIPVAVNWQRRLLLGNDHILRGFAGLTFGRRHSHYLLTQLWIAIVAILIGLGFIWIGMKSGLPHLMLDLVWDYLTDSSIGVDSALGEFLLDLVTIRIPAFFFMVIILLFVVRFLLILPAISTDVDRPVRATLPLGRGNDARLVLAFVISVVPISMPFLLLRPIAHGGILPSPDQLLVEEIAPMVIITAVETALIFLHIAVLASIEASAYAFLLKARTPAAGASKADTGR
jgi:hypothetical protein